MGTLNNISLAQIPSKRNPRGFRYVKSRFKKVRKEIPKRKNRQRKGVVKRYTFRKIPKE